MDFSEIKKRIDAYNKIAEASKNLPFSQIQKLMPIPRKKNSAKRKKVEEILKKHSVNNVEFFIEDMYGIIEIIGYYKGYTKTVFEFDRDTYETHIHHLEPISDDRIEKEFETAEKIIKYAKENIKNITLDEILSYIKDEVKILIINRRVMP